ncbi:MAG: phytase [Fuerstiella sp.]
MSRSSLKSLLSMAAFVIVDANASGFADLPTVAPIAVTSGMNGSEDVADDACVWIHTSNPSSSVIIGINKSDEVHGGLYLFHLDGSPLLTNDQWVVNSNWFAPGKKLNNVDSVSGFPAGTEKWDLVCASNRTDRSIDVLRVRTKGGNFDTLELVGRIPIGPGFAPEDDAPYGITIADGSQTKVWSAIVSDKLGRVAQVQLKFDPNGTATKQITGRRFDNAGRPWQISETGCPIEGIVADPVHQAVYIAAEDEGIFRYQFNHGMLAIETKVVVDAVGTRLQADVEGLTMYKHSDGTGYLLASSQGSNQYAAYSRKHEQGQPNQHVSNFQIGQTDRFDAVQSTDGIDAVFGNFGSLFPKGLFIAHDGEGMSPTHYKIVPWSNVQSVLSKAVNN